MSKKEQILEYFKDINVAYNDYTMHDTLEHMLEDLEEVRRGRWVNHISENGATDGKYCSICDYEVDRDARYKYCPDCGVKMDIDTPTDPVAK